MTKIKDNKLESLDSFPIGVFDSGLGGLTVVKELMRQLPHEDIVYLGDTARVPYGIKSKKTIIRFSIENAHVLSKSHVKMIVVACNSSSSYALSDLREQFVLPIVGVIGPGAKGAVRATRNLRVGVIATPATIASGQYEKELLAGNPRIQVFSQACPLFVPLVEEGWLTKSVTFDVAREYLQPLKEAGIDTLILGCTHYPLLRKVIQDVMGEGVALIDSAREVALEVKNILDQKQLSQKSQKTATYQFFTTDRPQQFEKMMKNFLGTDVAPAVKIISESTLQESLN